MPVNQEFPVLDGICPSFADISVRITPIGAPLIEMKDIKSIDSGSSVEVGEQLSAAGQVMKTTTGKPKHEASMVLYYSGFVKLLDGLALVAPSRGNEKLVSLVHFGMILIWTPPGSTDVFERRLKGVRFVGEKVGAAEGVDAQTVDVALHVKKIVNMRNGVEITLL